ncbi:MAG: GGDEF domain-containing protein [Campylobacterales bacterium]|nr:GGDEF domain-containing protein [Campylobacterales bacterium]
MSPILPEIWERVLELLDIAFQPILNIHTGKTYAVEALLRNYENAGFSSIFALFDEVYENNLLYAFDLALREKTLKKFTQIPEYENIKLFYNLDNRLFLMPDFSSGNTKAILKKLKIKKENICFEISERHEIGSTINLEKIVTHYQDENFCIAIDDFGIGYSGYKLLYDSTPDVIKVDRFFLQNIEKDAKKQLMLRSIVNLAIQLGIQVIAEGVETKAELLMSKDIGCHLVQGYLIQRPTQKSDEILQEYSNVIEVLKSSKRNQNHAAKIEHQLEKIEPLHKSATMKEVIRYFKEHKNIEVVPVLNSKDEPMGILYEKDIKEYLYSPFGISILQNDTTGKSKLKNFIIEAPQIDVHSDITRIIELYANNPQSAGIIVTSNSLYVGFLSARAIINIMNEENLIVARDQNPLTKLPGNRLIENYLSDVSHADESYMLCYFDLDNFKAYNDIYGFRNGDRVIQLFADTLRTTLPAVFFKAHIGGDDFFVANKVHKESGVCQEYIRDVIDAFCANVREFYSKEDQIRGHIISKDRENQTKEFPLLSVSASIIITNPQSFYNTNMLNEILSIQKKVAKSEAQHIAMSSII